MAYSGDAAVRNLSLRSMAMHNFLVWPDLAILYLLCLLAVGAAIFCAFRDGLKHRWLPFIVSLLILLVFPPFYTHVRIAHQARRARDLLEESRFGEAQVLLRQIVELRPHANWQGVDLSQALTRLHAIIVPMTDRVSDPLPADADADQRLARARDLAMLGRTEESLQTLAASPELDQHPAAHILRGAIDEAHGRWRAALKNYALAAAFLNDSNANPADALMHAKVLAGIGHCERKLGHLQRAESAYQQLLALSPTAQTQFLLAQFYEDTQQTSLAATHAHQAATLDPSQFEDRAKTLKAKLTNSHFGCLSAYGSR